MVDRDGLTNLLSRAKFFTTLTSQIQIQASFAIILVNLDRFRMVNENFTYSVGDAVLQEVSRRILVHAPSQAVVGRFGGNDFAIACVDLDIEQAYTVAERIRVVLAEPHSLSGADVVVTASVGVSIGTAGEVTIEQLIQRAEMLNQEAKNRGRNQICCESFQETAQSLSPLLVETMLRNALHKQELQIYYQPKVQAKSMQVVGAEALCRWRHEEYGEISPQDFIPVAESSDLILPIDEFVLRSVCLQGSQWLNDGYRVRVSVNVSGRQFLSPGFPDLVRSILKDTGMDPSLLELEITERTAMHDVDYVVQILQSLRELGVRTAIDDFGIGYSSLSYLMRFPVQTLKIDRSFTAGIQGAFNQDLVIGAIISLAKSLNLNVVAEGVETMQQLDFLRDRKCDEIQGFLFGEPVPPQSFRLSSFASRPSYRDSGSHSADQSTLVQQLHEHDWLERINLAALRRPRLSELISSIPDFILERVPLDRFSIDLLSRNQDYCVIHEASLRDDIPARVVGTLVPISHSGLTFIQRTQLPSECGDVLQSPEFAEDYSLSAEGIRSVIRVPLRRGRHIYGMMTLQSAHSNVYTDNDRRLLQRLATRLSDTIYAASLDGRMQDLYAVDETGCYSRQLLTRLTSIEDPALLLASVCERPYPTVTHISLLYLSITDFDRFSLSEASVASRHLGRLVQSGLTDHSIAFRMRPGDILVMVLGGETLASAHLVEQVAQQLSLVHTRAQRMGDESQAFDVRVGQSSGSWSNMDALYQQVVLDAQRSVPLGKHRTSLHRNDF